MSVSELPRNKTSLNSNSADRTSYYSLFNFNVLDCPVSIEMKIDSGSAYTIVGLKSLDVESRYLDEIVAHGNTVRSAYDASGGEIDLTEYIVNDFYLTDDIVFDKIVIYFSKRLEDRAVLGMDILSLFNHSYKLEKNQLIGTYWIQDYENSLKRYSQQRKNLGYYYPREIMLVDGGGRLLNDK